MAASELTQSSCPDNADADWCKKVKVKKIRVERKIIEKSREKRKIRDDTDEPATHDVINSDSSSIDESQMALLMAFRWDSRDLDYALSGSSPCDPIEPEQVSTPTSPASSLVRDSAVQHRAVVYFEKVVHYRSEVM